MYTAVKQMNCLGHRLVDKVSVTALAAPPDGTEVIVIQPKGGESFFWTDSPNDISDITLEGIEIPSGTAYLYPNKSAAFRYQGQALLMFYTSR